MCTVITSYSIHYTKLYDVAEFLINGAETFEQMLLELEARFVDLVQERLDEEQNYLEQAALNLKQGVRQLVTEEEHRFA